MHISHRPHASERFQWLAPKCVGRLRGDRRDSGRSSVQALQNFRPRKRPSRTDLLRRHDCSRFKAKCSRAESAPPCNSQPRRPSKARHRERYQKIDLCYACRVRFVLAVPWGEARLVLARRSRLESLYRDAITQLSAQRLEIASGAQDALLSRSADHRKECSVSRKEIEKQIAALKTEALECDYTKGDPHKWRETIDNIWQDIERFKFILECMPNKAT